MRRLRECREPPSVAFVLVMPIVTDDRLRPVPVVHAQLTLSSLRKLLGGLVAIKLPAHYESSMSELDGDQ